MTTKQFTVCGTSKLNGEYKVRFANDSLRIKVLAKHGHEDINLVELDKPMTKLDAVKFIQGLEPFAGKNEQAAIADYLERKEEAPKAANKDKPKKEVKKPKAPVKTPAKTKKATAKVEAVVTETGAPAVEPAKVAATADEDAPF